jgi:hypothetical protein
LNALATTNYKEDYMSKPLITLCCLLTMVTPVFADSAAAFSAEGVLSENDSTAAAAANSVEEDSFQDLIVPVQWGGRMDLLGA